MEMTHVVTFTVDKILDKADLAQSFCHKFVQICLQNEKWKFLLSNPVWKPGSPWPREPCNDGHGMTSLPLQYM